MCSLLIRRSIYVRGTDRSVHLFPWLCADRSVYFRGHNSQLVGTKACKYNYNYAQLTISVRIRSRNVRQVHVFSRYSLVSLFIFAALIDRSIYFRVTEQIHL